MPCSNPLLAWRTESREVVLWKEPPKATTSLLLPCGKCIGCNMDTAQAWALRCELELQQHEHASFVTLTYNDKYKPPTLSKPDLQKWLKRLRKANTKIHPNRTIRFFACGEYGEHTNRPHYHAIIFGLSNDSPEDRRLVDTTWTKGHNATYEVNSRTIAYVAGYTVKKNDDHWNSRFLKRQWLVDNETGELYRYQRPFRQMSLGIGRHGKKWLQSWRLYAIKDGHKTRVPRYLHNAWKNQATPLQLEELENEKYELTKLNTTPEYTRKAQEQIAKTRQQQQQLKRRLQ